MARLVRIVLALLLAATLATSPAPACCTDFWSCTEAVATAGVSCAVEAAVNAIKDLINQIGGQRDDAQARAEAALQSTLDQLAAEVAQVDSELKQLAQQVDKDRDEGEQIYRKDTYNLGAAVALARPAAATPTAAAGEAREGHAITQLAPTPAPAPNPFLRASVAELPALSSDDSLKRLRDKLDELKKQKEALVSKMQQIETQEAGSQVAAAAQAARDSLQNDFVKPVTDLLTALTEALSNPLGAASLIASAIGLLEDALGGLQNQTQPKLDAVGSAANGAAADLGPPLDQLRQTAADAEKTLATMRLAAMALTASGRQAFVRSLALAGKPTPALTGTRIRLSATAGLSAVSSKPVTKLVALRPDLRRLSQPARPVETSAFRMKITSDFDSFFRGKSAADARKKRDELLLEARRRFATNPKSLAAVEKLINDEARARGVF